MSYFLFLDDIRNPDMVTWQKIPKVNWTIVRNYEEFVKIIEERGMPSIVSFDHDLGAAHYINLENMLHDYEGTVKTFKEKTGYHCAQYLFNICLDKRMPLPEYHVHSLNPVGFGKIQELLADYDNAFRAYHG